MSDFISFEEIQIPTAIDFVVIEDQDEIRELLIDTLRDIGFNGPIIEAYDVASAVKVLKSLRETSYIISDWTLPDGIGRDILEAIRETERFAETPFLMVTANDDVNDVIDANNLGVSEYLIKPWSEEELKEKLFTGWKKNIRNKDEKSINC